MPTDKDKTKSTSPDKKKKILKAKKDQQQNAKSPKKITKKDPQAEIKPWLQYSQENKNVKKNPPKKSNIGPGLANLKRERRRAIFTKLGILLAISLLIVLGLIYYLSPISLTQKIVVKENKDIPVAEIIKSSGLKENEHILGQLFKKKQIENKLKYDYPSIKSVNIKMTDPTTLQLTLTQNDIIAYLETGSKYKKILKNGAVSKETITQKQINNKTIFIGYKNKKDLTQDIELFKKIPSEIRDNIKIINKKPAQTGQIVLIMTDQNVVIGDTKTLVKKLKFYPGIKKQLNKPSVIDLEIGAYSRPMSEVDKKTYLQ